MSTDKERAFTLIEVVVSSVILALFMAGLYQVIALGSSLWERGQGKIDEQQNVRIALNHVVRELRTAHFFDIGVKGPSDEPHNTIEMKIPNSKDDFRTYRSIRYYLKGENLLRDVDGAGHNIVAYGIQSICFSRGNKPNLVDISIVGESGFSVNTTASIRVDKSFLFQK
ncbi:MAG TPA: prepilin-type N-terminal cleavage/methylation domain-containing protein [Clostridia bacterium]|jgi:prepilin-type N-terminal cleavage/methylation domain-containing protein|nr:prepilin-type N-terminal cleavage/methylation domain-containing protein [Clostridia bacterium]